MPLRRLDTMPPGGLFYEQKNADGAVIKKFSSTTMPMAMFCKEIAAMRKANNLPRPDIKEVFEDVDEAQCQRLNFDPEWCQKKTTGVFLPSRLLKSASAGVRLAAQSFANELRAAKTLLDWGEDGFKPVAQEVAQARSDVCMGRISGNPCPFNQDKKIDLNSPVASVILSHIESKNQMRLTVEGEDKLNICMICNCVLKLKVFVPLDTLTGRMDAATISKFQTEYPPCWMNKPATQTPAP